MDKNKPTLAIYGIQDRQEYEHPFYVHDHNLALMMKGKMSIFFSRNKSW
jgi:carbamoyltransferase